jgi:molybdate transport system substrate-binding protein
MIRMKKWLTLFVVLLCGCGLRGEITSQSSPAARRLTVFAASSLTEAFSEAGTQFEASHPGVDVIFNFAGSQTLSRQILEGAQTDIFASANQAEMDPLVAAGLAEVGTSVVFVTNMMAVILLRITCWGLTLRATVEMGIKVVMAAAQVPAGQYARVALKNLNSRYGEGFDQMVLGNVVSNEENVRQVLAKVQLGEADAGFVYLSDTLAAPGLKMIVIPAQYGGVARYPVAILKDSHEPDLAQEFVKALLSNEMQAVLRRWGFGGKE